MQLELEQAQQEAEEEARQKILEEAQVAADMQAKADASAL